jgi:hypothetical protein
MYEGAGQHRTNEDHIIYVKLNVTIEMQYTSQLSLLLSSSRGHIVPYYNTNISSAAQRKKSPSTFTMEAPNHPSITIFRGWDTPTKYVWSPFVTKTEFRLRTASLPYTSAAGSPRTAPKGKIPYIELSTPTQPTECIADSTLISKSLGERGIARDLNANLTALQRGQDLAIRALFEEKLYFFTGHERWVKNYYTMRDHVLWAIPYPLRPVIGNLAYRGNVRKMYEQGSGRFSDEEISAFVREIWDGVSGVLEESRRGANSEDCFWVLGGEGPTEADSTVFGFVVSTLVCDAAPQTRELVKSEFPVVVEYAERIHRRWFPDYDMW